MSVDIDRLGDALVVRPGDTLLIRVSDALSRKDFDEYREFVEREIGPRLPGVKVLLINADQLAAYRPDAARDDAERVAVDNFTCSAHGVHSGAEHGYGGKCYNCSDCQRVANELVDVTCPTHGDHCDVCDNFRTAVRDDADRNAG